MSSGKQPAHGGARRGAGRPRMPAQQKRVVRTFKLPPDLVAYLASQPSATEAVERAIRSSPDFAAWAAAGGAIGGEKSEPTGPKPAKKA